MASPQCENGYTKIANEIMEALIAHRIPGEQMRVLLCIIRASYGWNEKSVSITHQEIADQTHMARQSVTRAIKGLATKKLLRCDKENNCLIFNKDFDEWENKPRRDTSNKKVAKTSNKKVSNQAPLPINIKKRKKPPISPTQKKKRFTPPTEQEVVSYFDENGYTEKSAKFAFHYYEAGEWHDSRGQKVKNWKQKMRGVWFKPENEKPPEQRSRFVG